MPYIEKKVYVDLTANGVPISLIFKRDNLESGYVSVLDIESDREWFAISIDDLRAIVKALDVPVE